MATELALTKPDATLDRDTLKTMMDAALRYVQSGLLPGEVNTPQKALVIMTAGRELGVPATYALRNIHVVKGKPVCSAELMLALVRRSYGPGAIRVAKTSNTACTVQYREQGWDGISEHTFTIEEAEQAGLFKNPVWKQYPAAMLRARCISAAVRFAFPEAIAGLYTPEEMGAEVVVNDDGHVQVVDSTVTTTALPGDIVDPPAPPDSESGTPSDIWGCDLCEATLHEVKFRDGTVWTPDELARRGQQKHEAVLCMNCYRQANDALRAAEEARNLADG